jgi:hypothetical protein
MPCTPRPWSGASRSSTPSDEEWGVRRFMLREPSGTVVNVVSHRSD